MGVPDVGTRCDVLHVLTETATGRLAVYDPARATITLTGNARLGSGPNTVQGEKVVVRRIARVEDWSRLKQDRLL